MGMSLRDFVGGDEANVAKQLIAAAADDRAKAVKGDVEAHKKVWLAKDEKERITLSAQAAVWDDSTGRPPSGLSGLRLAGAGGRRARLRPDSEERWRGPRRLIAAIDDQMKLVPISGQAISIGDRRRVQGVGRAW
jgi:hypothetical protein